MLLEYVVCVACGSFCGNWDESAWRVMGTALMLIRSEVLHDLHSNGPRGSQPLPLPLHTQG